MRLRRLVTMTVVLTTWGIFSGFGFFQTRSERCEKIPPGASLVVIAEVLGEQYRKDEKNGVVSVYFQADPFSDGPIIAFVDAKSGKVQALLCRFGGPVSWRISE